MERRSPGVVFQHRNFFFIIIVYTISIKKAYTKSHELENYGCSISYSKYSLYICTQLLPRRNQ